MTQETSSYRIKPCVLWYPAATTNTANAVYMALPFYSRAWLGLCSKALADLLRDQRDVWMMRALSTRDRALKFYCLLIMAASIIERLLANTWYNRLRHYRCSRVLRNLVNLAIEFKVRKDTILYVPDVQILYVCILYLSIFLCFKIVEQDRTIHSFVKTILKYRSGLNFQLKLWIMNSKSYTWWGICLSKL